MEKLVPDMNEFLTLDQNSDDYLDQVVGILGKVDQAFVDAAGLDSLQAAIERTSAAAARTAAHFFFICISYFPHGSTPMKSRLLRKSRSRAS